MSKKLRALDLILQRGLIADEKEARACLMAGQVYSGSRRIAGASEMLPIDCELHVRGMDMPFVSKGGLKLSGAIRDFGIDVTAAYASTQARPRAALPTAWLNPGRRWCTQWTWALAS